MYPFLCKERWLHIKLAVRSTSGVWLLCGRRGSIFLPTNGRVSQVYDYGEQRVAFISLRRVIIIALQIYGLLLERTYQQEWLSFLSLAYALLISPRTYHPLCGIAITQKQKTTYTVYCGCEECVSLLFSALCYVRYFQRTFKQMIMNITVNTLNFSLSLKSISDAFIWSLWLRKCVLHSLKYLFFFHEFSQFLQEIHISGIYMPIPTCVFLSGPIFLF